MIHHMFMLNDHMSQNNPDKDDQTSSSKKTISLPISRVRLIMKSSPDVSSINQDALFLTTKATELFVQHLALSSFNSGSGKETNTLSYSDLAHTAEETETFHFLTGEASAEYNSLYTLNRYIISLSQGECPKNMLMN
ncbi:hypothetical protein L3Q82_003075 [Scortum barcoo]|uniref:Uncharacterized protein n=1 Tax=Scortum barcoo TaxID=214431 RepID=A0ACB8VRL8_9TELE|nr:hypothetical protein L3Q82_003075 [Scortum barcoo]